MKPATKKQTFQNVSILVLMDYLFGHGNAANQMERQPDNRFNPCFDGLPFRTS